MDLKPLKMSPGRQVCIMKKLPSPQLHRKPSLPALLPGLAMKIGGVASPHLAQHLPQAEGNLLEEVGIAQSQTDRKTQLRLTV